MHRQFAALQVAIAQQQQELAVAHGLLRLLTQAVERIDQAHSLINIQIEERVRILEHGRTQELPQFRLGQYRRVDQHLFRVLGSDVEQAAFATHVGLQRHDDAFAQRVNRRIGHLCELLPEVIEW